MFLKGEGSLGLWLGTESIKELDVIITSTELMREMRSWGVLDDLTLSDHRYDVCG